MVPATMREFTNATPEEQEIMKQSLNSYHRLRMIHKIASNSIEEAQDAHELWFALDAIKGLSEI